MTRHAPNALLKRLQCIQSPRRRGDDLVMASERPRPDRARWRQVGIRDACVRAGFEAKRRRRMALADLTVNFTLNNFTILVILGVVAGLVTGQLMKSKGWMVLA